MIAPACHPWIDQPVKACRQIFNHAARLPSPRTGNGRHHPQSAAGPTFMREPCGHPHDTPPSSPQPVTNFRPYLVARLAAREPVAKLFHALGRKDMSMAVLEDIRGNPLTGADDSAAPSL